MIKPNIKSIFYFNLILYVLIITISVLIAGFAYIKAQKAIESEALRANMAVFERACNYLDSQFNQVSDLMNSVALNKRIDDFVSIKEPMSEETRYNIQHTINDMSLYKYNLTFITDYYIYFKNSNTVLSPTSKYDPELFFSYIYNNLL